MHVAKAKKPRCKCLQQGFLLAKPRAYLILVFLRFDFTLALAGTVIVFEVLGFAVVVVDSTVVEDGVVCAGSIVVVVAGVVAGAGVAGSGAPVAGRAALGIGIWAQAASVVRLSPPAAARVRKKDC